MKRIENKVGFFVACIALVYVVVSIGYSSNAAWFEMPLEAVNGIAFSFGYFFRLHAVWAYVCSGVFFYYFVCGEFFGSEKY
ncbi:hypothetical protein [Photobacterium leiognathi]|uniref:hypothetical protein n=1 Tax=Photobacterium leiognathi TaxID=553611 RepID=UPI001E56AC29|nr:hypothetical protein [Photobacterium leiognathi]